MIGHWITGAALAVVIAGGAVWLAVLAGAEIGNAIERFGDDFASDPRPASLLSALSHPSSDSDEREPNLGY